jgi:hypothetical protein
LRRSSRRSQVDLGGGTLNDLDSLITTIKVGDTRRLTAGAALATHCTSRPWLGSGNV